MAKKNPKNVQNSIKLLVGASGLSVGVVTEVAHMHGSVWVSHVYGHTHDAMHTWPCSDVASACHVSGGCLLDGRAHGLLCHA